MRAAQFLLTQLPRRQLGKLGPQHRTGGTAKYAANSLACDRRGDACDVLEHRRGAAHETADAAEGALEELLALLVFELEFTQFTFAFAQQTPEAGNEIAKELLALLMLAEFGFTFEFALTLQFTFEFALTLQFTFEFALALQFTFEFALALQFARKPAFG